MLLRSFIPVIKAVIFDMDGVLVDSESQHYRAHKAAIREQGGQLTKEFYSAHGVSRDPLLLYADVFPHRKNDKEFLEGIYRRKLQIYQELQHKEGILPVKPAVALAKYFYDKHMPLAVGTAVHRGEAINNLKTLGIDQYFQAIVTFDDVGVKRKPAPDIYLKVSELLNIPSRNCLVIEDSENGVKAALGAGMHTVVVPHEFTQTHNFSGAIIARSFEEIGEAFGKESGI
ncbi:HAD family phosphatase [Candidatus Jorgensenbacteria bacterium]|nr:HAD family phosphatase [Candidatus Jorgensenbacteria bacterium]